MDLEFLDLSLEIQLIFVGGYLGYKINSGGLGKGHKHMDSFFQIISFGFVSYITFNIITFGFTDIYNDENTPVILQWKILLSSVASVMASIGSAIIWRKTLFPIYIKKIRELNISGENYFPSTWDAIIHSNENPMWEYVAVKLKSGYILQSDLHLVPNWVPRYPLDTDSEGNIAIYVTHLYKPNTRDSEEFSDATFSEELKSSCLTFIPKEEIASIDITWKSVHGINFSA